jgi:hypothetical protein
MSVLKINFPYGKMCEKSISNHYMFAVGENQTKQNNFPISKSAIQTAIQSVIHVIKKERNIKLLKYKTR